ncbi:MAG TPA: hypothetical protein VGM10_03605 [Actinocrinis sp.]
MDVTQRAQARAERLQEFKERDLQALKQKGRPAAAQLDPRHGNRKLPPPAEPRDAIPSPVILSAARRWWGHWDLRLQLLVGGVIGLVLIGAAAATEATLIRALDNGRRPRSTASFGADLGLALGLLGLAIVPLPLLIALRYKPIALHGSPFTGRQVMAGAGLAALEVAGAAIAANGFALHHEPARIAHAFADIGISIGVVLFVELVAVGKAWDSLTGRTRR